MAFYAIFSEIKAQLNSDMELWGKWVEAWVRLSCAGRRLQAAIDCLRPRRGPEHSMQRHVGNVQTLYRAKQIYSSRFFYFLIKLVDVRKVHVAAPQSATVLDVHVAAPQSAAVLDVLQVAQRVPGANECIARGAAKARPRHLAHRQHVLVHRVGGHQLAHGAAAVVLELLQGVRSSGAAHHLHVRQATQQCQHTHAPSFKISRAHAHAANKTHLSSQGCASVRAPRVSTPSSCFVFYSSSFASSMPQHCSSDAVSELLHAHGTVD